MARERVLCWVLSAVACVGLFAGSVDAGYLQAQLPPAGDFTRPRNNPFLPDLPGSTRLYVTRNKDYVILNEVTETFNTITLQGIRCRVVRDTEWTYVRKLDRRFKTRETYNFYAWDNGGNVWDFGRDDLKYVYSAGWRLLGINMKGSWLAGKNGALPGIIMPANPQAGLSFQQQFHRARFEDKGQVIKLNQSISTRLGHFRNCIEVKVSTPLAPDRIEYRYYAPHVGLVFIKKPEGTRANTELVAMLGPSARRSAPQLLSEILKKQL